MIETIGCLVDDLSSTRPIGLPAGEFVVLVRGVFFSSKASSSPLQITMNNTADLRCTISQATSHAQLNCAHFEYEYEYT